MQTISCVICAHNEAPRIGAVLSAVARHPLLHEIIVVDDGSTDRTSLVALSFPGVRVIRLEKNRGKSGAMAEGVKAARGELLCLVDADLRGLTPENISALLLPVLAREADVSISLPGSAWPLTRLTDVDVLSGQRVVPRELLQRTLEQMRSLPPFGIEVFMNQLIVRQRLRISVVRWDGVTNVPKTLKIGWWRGMRAQTRMASHVYFTLSPISPIMQTYSLSLLRSDLAWVSHVRWLQRTSHAWIRNGLYEITGIPPKSSF